MIENLTDVVSTVGFPIAVVIYLLWERQSMSKEMLKTLRHLEIAIIKLEGKLAAMDIKETNGQYSSVFDRNK